MPQSTILLRSLPFLLILLASCSHAMPAEALTALPTTTTSILPATKPLSTDLAYPVLQPTVQTMPYPAPAETTLSTPTLVPNPTQTLIPSPTVLAAIPPNLDSLRIVFTSEKNLLTWFRGETKLLTETDEALYLMDVSSDGERIAYKLPSGLWVINSDGSGKQLVVGKDQIQVANQQPPGRKTLISDFHWIPNTHRLLINTEIDPEGQCCYSYNNDLYLVDTDTSTLETLLPPGNAGLLFTISPDGLFAAISSRGAVSLFNLNTHEMFRLIEYEPLKVPSEGGETVMPLWSNDSQYMMLVIPPTDYFYGTDLPTNIWKLPVDRSSPTLIGTFGPEFGWVHLSPDFQTVVTSRQIGGTDPVYEIHIAKADGSAHETYQTGPSALIGWVPNSQYFLPASNEKYSLGQRDVDPLVLPFPTYYELRWIDSQSLLYQSGTDQLSEIQLGLINGSSIRLVGPTAIHNFDFVH